MTDTARWYGGGGAFAALFAALLASFAPGAGEAQPAEVAPDQIIGGVAPVGPANTTRDPADGMQVVTHRPDPAQARRPILHESMQGPAAVWIRNRARRGWASGMGGFLYDNRDRGHAPIGLYSFPQLAATQYAKAFRDRGLDYGIAGPLRFEMPVIGNSSTARTRGPFARSQARAAVEGPAAAARAFRLYETNHLYFYPEHRDHDPGTDDRFFANAPFFVTSQGSSRSERRLMRGAAMALAAMRPDTFAAARDLGLVAPTLQMLLRSNRPPIDYLTGAAHPSAIPGASLDMEALVQAAGTLLPDEIPPLVRLSVEEDFTARPGLDYPDPRAREALYTTPAGIARAWRSLDHRREIVLSAEGTQDPHGRALVYDWVVLRGDPARIAISHDPDDTARVRARIALDWHEAYPVPGRPGMRTARVDIGVFARDPDDPEAPISAPSILSVAFPVHQARRYAPGPDGTLRLAEISYRWPEQGTGYARGYVDPTLWATANWSDSYAYPTEGGFATVTRTYANGTTRTLRQSLRGLVDPATGMPVRHNRITDPRGRPRIVDDRPTAASAADPAE